MVAIYDLTAQQLANAQAIYVAAKPYGHDAVMAALMTAGVGIFLQSIYIIPVLNYHSIDTNDTVTKLCVSPQSFERQMNFLYTHPLLYNLPL